MLIPAGIHWQNYTDAVNSAPFGHWYLNSVIVSTVVVVSNLVFCSLAAYAFARIRFAGSNILFVALLATLMVPFQVVLIPTFLIVRHLGLIDNLSALIAPNLASAFGIFMLRQFFRTLPIELEEAARIDGCSRLGVLVKIVLPLSVPALSTLALITLLWTWNDFLWPLVAINTESHMTLQVGPLHLPGAAPDEVDDPHGRQHARAPADAGRLRAHPAVVRPLDRRVRHQGLSGVAEVEFRGVTKRFGDVVAVDALSLAIADGEFMVLVGPSGCGKTTALRMVAGLEKPTEGEIVIGDRVVNDDQPGRRDIAMVFQNYALYPHMSVERNIGFGLRQRRMPRAADRRAGEGGERPARARRAAAAKAGAALGRPAPAGRDGPGARAPSRRRSCSTSRCPTSTPSCAPSCGPSSSGSTSSCRRPRSTSPTTRSRR